MSNTTDTYDAAIITIDGKITPEQARERIEKAKRLTQCAKYGVPVVELQDRNLKSICRKLGVEL